MIDQKKWNVGRCQLDALRRNIPAWKDEKRVSEYHAILDLLQEASNDTFSYFRIPRVELEPKVVSWTPATHRRRGSVNYSQKVYCDDDFFIRKVEAASQFASDLEAAEKPTRADAPKRDARLRSQNPNPQYSNVTHIHNMRSSVIQQGTQGSHANINPDRNPSKPSIIARCLQSIRNIFENAAGGFISVLLSKYH